MAPRLAPKLKMMPPLQTTKVEWNPLPPVSSDEHKAKMKAMAEAVHAAVEAKAGTKAAASVALKLGSLVDQNDVDEFLRDMDVHEAGMHDA